jgi:prefoldin subunit 4
MPHARAMKRLEVEQKSIDTQIDKHANSAEECEKGMGELKRVLYAKFGSAINLDE